MRLCKLKFGKNTKEEQVESMVLNATPNADIETKYVSNLLAHQNYPASTWRPEKENAKPGATW